MRFDLSDEEWALNSLFQIAVMGGVAMMWTKHIHKLSTVFPRQNRASQIHLLGVNPASNRICCFEFSKQIRHLATGGARGWLVGSHC